MCLTKLVLKSYLHCDLNFFSFLAKLEKSDGASSSKAGGETAKLATLTKAIDSIQENSKSLETMGKY